MTDINLDGIATWLSDWFQEKLVSGTNLKTINNQSLLGSGNISVGGGGNVPTKTSDLVNDGDDGINPFISSHQTITFGFDSTNEVIYVEII